MNELATFWRLGKELASERLFDSDDIATTDARVSAHLAAVHNLHAEGDFLTMDARTWRSLVSLAHEHGRAEAMPPIPDLESPLERRIVDARSACELVESLRAALRDQGPLVERPRKDSFTREQPGAWDWNAEAVPSLEAIEAFIAFARRGPFVVR